MRYTKEQFEQFPWDCSHGTLRPDHLAAAYLQTLDALRKLGVDHAALGEFDRAELAALANRAGDPVGEEPTDCALMAVSAAEELLGGLAPAGFYFGAHEGDGSSFGFWIMQEWVEALEERGIDADGTPGDVAYLLQQFEDHGIDADSLCDAYCGTASGWNESEAGAAYAGDLAEELGVIDADARWPHTCIDWQDAWRELELGDGYALIPAAGAGTFHVVRSI